MKRYGFSIGLLSTLFGLAIIVIVGSRKPPIDLPAAEWRPRIAEVHLGWMIGGAICLFGLALILSDTFSRNQRVENIEVEEKALREEILSSLPQANLDQQELNELIVQSYGRNGLIGLTIEQMQEVRTLIKRRILEQQ